MLYFGLSCLINEFSKISASASLGVTMYSRCMASLIIFEILGLSFSAGARVGVNLK